MAETTNSQGTEKISVPAAVGAFDFIDMAKLFVIFACIGFATWLANKLVIYALIKLWNVDMPEWA